MNISIVGARDEQQQLMMRRDQMIGQVGQLEGAILEITKRLNYLAGVIDALSDAAQAGPPPEVTDGSNESG